ncbi:hypothetical protein NPIL_390151 [Nephila pilipes]|uniref:Uncharacterized protein n=1 Tax=Nephila pilipes TaxID=299642 RepID=A0A8X6R247_NEPPI|nr:hypothetical protein NPIL_390151 [Nephila pilipes]
MIRELAFKIYLKHVPRNDDGCTSLPYSNLRILVTKSNTINSRKQFCSYEKEPDNPGFRVNSSNSADIKSLDFTDNTASPISISKVFFSATKPNYSSDLLTLPLPFKQPSPSPPELNLHSPVREILPLFELKQFVEEALTLRLRQTHSPQQQSSDLPLQEASDSTLQEALDLCLKQQASYPLQKQATNQVRKQKWNPVCLQESNSIWQQVAY